MFTCQVGNTYSPRPNVLKALFNGINNASLRSCFRCRCHSLSSSPPYYHRVNSFSRAACCHQQSHFGSAFKSYDNLSCVLPIPVQDPAPGSTISKCKGRPYCPSGACCKSIKIPGRLQQPCDPNPLHSRQCHHGVRMWLSASRHLRSDMGGTSP